MLTDKQIDAFKEDGFLILKDYFSEACVAHWREACARRYGIGSIDDWRPGYTPPGGIRPLQIEPRFQLARYGDFPGILAQLGSGAEDGRPNLIFKYPNTEPGAHRLPETGHVDLIFQGSRRRFTLGALSYLNETVPGQGATCAWPGSHKPVWRFFQANPDAYAVGFDNDLRHKMESRLNAFTDYGAPVELTASPRDLILWHAFLLHEASPNAGTRPRLAVFHRFGQALREGEPFETFGDIWEHWAIGGGEKARGPAACAPAGPR